MFLLNNFMVLVKIVMIITLLWYYGTNPTDFSDNFTISWINWFEGLPQIIGDFSDYIKAT